MTTWKYLADEEVKAAAKVLAEMGHQPEYEHNKHYWTNRASAVLEAARVARERS